MYVRQLREKLAFEYVFKWDYPLAKFLVFSRC